MASNQLAVHCIFLIGLIIGSRSSANPVGVANVETNATLCVTDNVCLTAGCVSAASRILEKIDPTVDPCDDFYQFACGKFIENAILTDDMSEENTVANINRRIEYQIRDILSKEPTQSDLNAFKMAKTFYNSCMDENSIEKRGVQPLIDLIKSLGGWPVLEGDRWNESGWNWYDVYTEMFVRGLDLSPLFRLKIIPSAVNSTANRIFFDDTDKFGIAQELLQKGSNDSKVQKYFELMVDIAELLGANRGRAELELNESFEFEIGLANIEAKRFFDPNVLGSTKVDLDESSLDRVTIKDAVAAYPYFPWMDFFNAVLPNSVAVKKDEIIIFSSHIFDDLEPLLNATSKRTLANYFMWRVVRYSSDYLSEALQHKVTAFNSITTGVKTGMHRSVHCTKATTKSFKMAVDSMWVRKHFKEEWKQLPKEIVNRVHKEFVLSLHNSTWMDEKTKSYAIEKAESMHSFIAYPDWMLNDTKLEMAYDGIDLRPDDYFRNILHMNQLATKEKFEMLRIPEDLNDWAHYGSLAGITTVNAYYAARHNSIHILAAFLQDGLFSVEYPNYLNYGVLGWTIGHEITHGYDEDGSRLDKEGNIVNWWEEDTYGKFMTKATCFHAQYANYSQGEFNMRTSNEDIADNGGAKVARRAYQKYVQENGSEKKLPGLDYTPQQLFWISMASLLCTARRPQMQELEILTNKHTPEKYRIIGTASNTPAFAEDFSCPEGSNMNPAEKCEIW